MIEKLQGEDLVPESAAGLDPAGDAVQERRLVEDSVLAATESAPRLALAAPELEPVEAPPPEPAEDLLIALEGAELRGAIEAVLFSVSEPIAIRALADVVGAGVHEVRAAVEDLRLEYLTGERAFRLEDIAGGVQLLTQSKYDPWIRRLRQKEKESRLTPAALESLAVIAYKQPISKADLEGIRGVGCGPTLKTLLERGLIQIVGRSEALGKPLLYGTTKRFLESFGIASVRELPQPELLERPPQLEASALPRPSLEYSMPELPEGSVPDAPVADGPREEAAVEASEASSLADADGPLS